MEPSMQVERKTDLALVIILGCAILTAILDALMGLPGMIFSDIPLVGVTGYYGLVWAKATGAPQLLKRDDIIKPRPLLPYALLAATLLLTVINTTMNVGYIRAHGLASEQLQMMLSTPLKGLLLAIRAGITEEIPFRLFVGPLVLWLLHRSKKTMSHAYWLAPLLTTFPFALIVHPFVPIAYVSSLLLSVIYFEYGAMPAISAHFLLNVGWAVLVPTLGLV